MNVTVPEDMEKNSLVLTENTSEDSPQCRHFLILVPKSNPHFSQQCQNHKTESDRFVFCLQTSIKIQPRCSSLQEDTDIQ